MLALVLVFLRLPNETIRVSMFAILLVVVVERVQGVWGRGCKKRRGNTASKGGGHGKDGASSIDGNVGTGEAGLEEVPKDATRGNDNKDGTTGDAKQAVEETTVVGRKRALRCNETWRRTSSGVGKGATSDGDEPRVGRTRGHPCEQLHPSPSAVLAHRPIEPNTMCVPSLSSLANKDTAFVRAHLALRYEDPQGLVRRRPTYSPAKINSTT